MKNSWSVSARLEPGECLGAVTTCPDLASDLEESDVEVCPQSQPLINSVNVSSDRQAQLLKKLHLGQSSATAEEIEQLRPLICENADYLLWTTVSQAIIPMTKSVKLTEPLSFVYVSLPGALLYTKISVCG